MARGRFLNASVAADIALNSLSLEAHWLYMMTIPHLDRDGLIIADTYVFFGKVCPRRPELIPNIDAMIEEWAKAGLVTIYPTHAGKVAFFHGFTKNQQGMHYAREGASALHPPPGYVRTKTGLEPNNGDGGNSGDDSTKKPNPDLLLTNSRPTPAEIEVKDQYQVEDQSQVQGVPTVHATAIDDFPQDDGLDPKALIADLRARRFAYIDKEATSIAARLIADFGWAKVMEAADKAEAQHLEKIAGGTAGIIAPLAYMRSVLQGGIQQARTFPAQSMGEASVDKFFARVAAKGH